MIARYAALALFAAAQLVIPQTVQARTTMTRREIRQTPITQRPSRPGHFYGNAVRRNSQATNTVTSSGDALSGKLW